MMEITRDVILDLLPLYLADEVSADTRVLVEAYLETDPELARIAEQSAALELADDVPIPFNKEDEMEAYEEAKRVILRRTAIWALLIAFILCMLASVGLIVMAFLVTVG
jgi:anti-sigma factor RsiW